MLKRGSLQQRLMLWLMLPLLLVTGLILMQSWHNARSAADRAYDRLLAASALAIADRVVVVDGRLDIDLPYVALELLASGAQDRVFYRITDPDGQTVTGYGDLPEPQHPPVSPLVFYNSDYRGATVRVVSLRRPLTGPTLSGYYQVQVAQTRGERDDLVRSLASSTGWQLLLMVVLMAVLTGIGVRRSLTPLDRLSREIRNRALEDYRPLMSATPLEVRDLVWAVDNLMLRLARNHQAMQSFISDASHQLRTPLAVLQTQTELAMREQEPGARQDILARLYQASCRTSRLASQLLSHARSMPDSVDTRRQPIDLVALATTTTREQVPAALRLNTDLGFESELPEAIVNGDPLLMEELLKNLIDNALNYCPPESRITVAVRRAEHDNGVILEVDDDGPGINASERQRVFQRFYRLPGSHGDGSGLGLAIVRMIAENHGGSVSLHCGRSGRGLGVRLELPFC